MGADTLRKACTKCKEEKPLDEFGSHRGRPDGKNSQCKECDNKRSRRWRRRNRQKVSGGNYLRTYGVTAQEVQSLIDAQDGRCAICKKRPSRGKLHFDHCHVSGQHRGMICINCNHGLGKFFDSTSLLRAAIKYLERSKKRDSNSTSGRGRVPIPSQCELRI